VRQGYGEVVLTGVDLSSWGGDLPGQPPLGDLVRRVLKLVPELKRLRLSSIDPAEVDDVLFEALTTEPRMTPYLHLRMENLSSLKSVFLGYMFFLIPRARARLPLKCRL